MTTHDTDADAATRLVRVVADWFLDPANEAITAVEDAALAGIGPPYDADPVVAREVRESTRVNVRHWVSSMASAPRVPVTPIHADPVVGIAREVIRRGDERAIWSAYHVARDEAWRLWMQRSFTCNDDPEVLATALGLVSASLGPWVRATLDELAALVARERDDYAWQSHSQRLAVLTGVLDADPTQPDVAERRLGYRFRGDHLAAVLWTDAAAPDQAALMRVAAALHRQVDAAQSVAVPASSSSAWLWLGVHHHVDPRRLGDEFDVPTVHLALGTVAAGLDGFRRSHFDALSTQSLLLRVPGVRAAAFDDVALVHLAAQNEQAARAYASRVLGDLAKADHDLRTTARVFSRKGHSVTRAAAALFTHRNTVLGRLRRADQLLPGQWSTRSLEVAVALEIDHWIGSSS